MNFTIIINNCSSFSPISDKSTLSSFQLGIVALAAIPIIGEIYNWYKSSRKVIPFDQGSDIISKLDKTKHKEIIKINNNFNGICEIICNRILFDNLLGKGNSASFLRKKITIEKINEKKIIKSHILFVYSVFKKIIAFLFGIYPDNIFSFQDQIKLVKTNSQINKKFVNRELLSKELQKIPEENVLKLEIFKKSGFLFAGHSLLIKKTQNERYIFFDPNTGEHRDLSFDQLCDHIDQQIEQWKATDLFFMKSNDFLKKAGLTQHTS